MGKALKITLISSLTLFFGWVAEEMGTAPRILVSASFSLDIIIKKKLSRSTRKILSPIFAFPPSLIPSFFPHSLIFIFHPLVSCSFSFLSLILGVPPLRLQPGDDKAPSLLPRVALLLAALATGLDGKCSSITKNYETKLHGILIITILNS